MPIQSASDATTLSHAIEAHQVAKRAWYAQSEAARNADDDPLFDALLTTERDLVSAPTASDAEFVRKLAYLHGDAGGDFGTVIDAVKFHFEHKNA